MATWIWLIMVTIGIVGGFVGGFFMGRRAVMDHLKENPPINERMIVQMMAQMGQKPSKKKVQQIMNSMKYQQ